MHRADDCAASFVKLQRILRWVWTKQSTTHRTVVSIKSDIPHCKVFTSAFSSSPLDLPNRPLIPRSWQPSGSSETRNSKKMNQFRRKLAIWPGAMKFIESCNVAAVYGGKRGGAMLACVFTALCSSCRERKWVYENLFRRYFLFRKMYSGVTINLIREKPNKSWSWTKESAFSGPRNEHVFAIQGMWMLRSDFWHVDISLDLSSI